MLDYFKQHYIILLLLIIISIICICIFLSILVFIFVIGYILFQINDLNKTGNFIQMNDYDENTKKCLSTYSDYKIKKLYLVTCPIRDFIVKLLNYITFFKYYHAIKLMYPFHTKLLLLVKKGNETKFLTIHKSPSLIITQRTKIHESNTLRKIPIRSLHMTLHEVLSSVKKEMGTKYLNWNIVDNDCQYFSRIFINILKKKKIEYVKEGFIQILAKTSNYTMYDIYILNVVSSLTIMYLNCDICRNISFI